MENHKCCDCGKNLEPDEQLRFFENDQAAGRPEGYLCVGCADRRIKEWDPDFTKVTPEELLEQEEALAEYARGECVTLEDIMNSA